MSAPDVIDAVPADEDEQPQERYLPAPAPSLAVAPQVKPADLVKRLADIKETMESAMEDGVDYGVIPGTNKPTLLKPGAEKLAVLFQLDVQIKNEQRFEADNHLTVTARATVYHAPTGARLGYGEGLCTTHERKYAKRRQERTCPACGAEAVIKGKKEFGGGWLCWKKRNGCGEKFADGDEGIESQEVGEIDNPDLPDLWNTVTKMAEKRARVDAVLAVTGASALFTQDMEDTATAAAEQSTTPAESAGPEEKITARQMSAFILPAKRKANLSNDAFQEILRRFDVHKLEDLPRARVKALHTTIVNSPGDVPADMEGLPGLDDTPPPDTDGVPFE